MIQLNIQTPTKQKRIEKLAITCLIALLVYLAIGIAGRLIEDTISRIGLDSSVESAEFQNLAVVALITLVWTLLASSIQLTFLAKRVFQKSNLASQSTAHLINQLAIENTRSLAACIIRIPLFIVPAVLEWVRLLPISYVVLLDADYMNGKVDALRASRRFFSSHKTFVLLLTLPLMFGFILELFLTDSPIDSLPIWSAPLQHIGSIAIIACIRLAIDGFSLWAYNKKFGPISNLVD